MEMFEVPFSTQGHMEAYGSYQELKSSGVDLMGFIQPEGEERDKEMFCIHETEPEEKEENKFTTKEYDTQNISISFCHC